MIRTSFVVAYWLPSFFLLSVLCCLGCKEPIPTADSVDQSLAGSWTLAKGMTLEAQIKILRDQNVLRTEDDVQSFRLAFASTYFSIELAKDASFTCSMGNSLDRGVFSGYWNTTGDKIEMVQTHEGNKEKRDVMDGRIIDGRLHMNHTAQGVTVKYIFERDIVDTTSQE